MNIKAVVFDYGQVICFPQDPKLLGSFARRIGVDREKFESLVWTLREGYDRGTLTSREYYKEILSRLGVSMDDKSIDEMAEKDLDSWKNINGGTVSIMEDVKKSGYILGILSNMPHDFLVWARENVPVFSLASVSLFSCEVGLVKPEEAIYRKLLSLLGLDGNEVVFFDDNADNVKIAKSLGIEAFLWESPESARRVLSSLGVKL